MFHFLNKRISSFCKWLSISHDDIQEDCDSINFKKVRDYMMMSKFDFQYQKLYLHDGYEGNNESFVDKWKLTFTKDSNQEYKGLKNLSWLTLRTTDKLTDNKNPIFFRARDYENGIWSKNRIRFPERDVPLSEIPPVIEVNGGTIPHVERDSNGNLIRAYGRIDSFIRNGGTCPSVQIQRQIQSMGERGDQTCHIIPQVLGGSGRHLDNFYPGNAHLNMGMYSAADRWLANIVEDPNITIVFDYYFEYADENYPHRPSYIHMDIFFYRNGKFKDIMYDGDPNYHNKDTESSKQKAKKRENRRLQNNHLGGLQPRRSEAETTGKKVGATAGIVAGAAIVLSAGAKGAAAGALVGPAGAVVGAAIGGVVGFVAGTVGGKIYDWWR